LSELLKVVQLKKRAEPKPVNSRKCKKVLRLGSSQCKRQGHHLLSTLGDGYSATGMFKPNAALSGVV